MRWGMGNLGCREISADGSEEWNENGAGGLHARNMVEYVVCGNAVVVGGVHSTHRKLVSRATRWWWWISTLICWRVKIPLEKLHLGPGTSENRCAPSRRYIWHMMTVSNLVLLRNGKSLLLKVKERWRMLAVVAYWRWMILEVAAYWRWMILELAVHNNSYLLFFCYDTNAIWRIIVVMHNMYQKLQSKHLWLQALLISGDAYDQTTQLRYHAS